MSVPFYRTCNTNNALCFIGPCLIFFLSTIQSLQSFLIDDHPSHALRVASFNIKRFGNTVMSKDGVPDYIVRILQRYDLVFIMETRDSRETSLVKLRDMLGSAEWDYVASDPVGRSTYKEQYVYFYRPSVVQFISAIFYNDSAKDVFEREPYLVQFQYWSQAAGSVGKVTFAGVHIKPDDAVAEMGALPNVISSALQLFPDSGGVITMGDFNADCGYTTIPELAAVVVLNTPDVYTSFVSDTADTTVAHGTKCAYDRVVFKKGQGLPEVKVANVKVYDFQLGLGVTEAEAYSVSDHYPVEFTLE